MKITLTHKDLEDYAFYQSGLSANGCLEKLDSYTIKAIEKYGRILLQKQKENFKEGFQGCCYCCEPVGILNQELEAVSKKLYSVALHVHEVSNTNPVTVIGPNLYNETVEAIKEYEKITNGVNR